MATTEQIEALKAELHELKFSRSSLSVSTVSVKLPEWWPDNARLWFIQAEAQFNLRGIKDQKTKFWHVVATIDNATASRLEDILVNPPAENPYDAIKTRLVGAYTPSTYQQMERLADVCGLGDRRPSQLLDDLLALAVGTCKEGCDRHVDCCFSPFLRFLFLRSLPEAMRNSLVQHGSLDLRRLAAMADDVWHGSSRPTVCEVQPADEAVVEPTVAVVAPQERASATKKKKKKQSTSDAPASWCNLHRRFGDRAYRCRQPCDFPGNCAAGGSN